MRFATYRIMSSNRSLTVEITEEGTVILPIGTKLEDGNWTVLHGEDDLVIGAFTVTNGVPNQMVAAPRAMRVHTFSDDPHEAFTALMEYIHPLPPKNWVDALLKLGDKLCLTPSTLPCPDCGQQHMPLTDNVRDVLIDKVREALVICDTVENLKQILVGPQEYLPVLGYASREEVADQRDKLQKFIIWADTMVSRPADSHAQAVQA
ncbi:hypothetical protein KBC55_01680 [Patescibacteria group bacterium]|nr:hypothetical protein [Patescibacteria group bacterium]